MNSLTRYALLVVLSVCGSEQQSVTPENTDGDGRTLGHVIRGSHALAETFISGLFDGSYHLGNRLGHLASPGVPVAVPQVFHQASSGVPLYANYPGYGCSYGYGGGCLFNSPAVGHFPGGPEPVHYGHGHSGLHRPGFEGTYISQPLHKFDRGGPDDLEPVPYDIIETDKTLFRR